MFLSKNISPEAKQQAIRILAQVSNADKYKIQGDDKANNISKKYAKALSSKLMQRIDSALPK